MRHPHQPVITDDRGVRRFLENPIITYLLDNFGPGMNALVRIHDFSDEDRAHFAQLIGYSVSGWSDLSYVSEEDIKEVETEDL